jgi:hypothetical protein
MVLSGVVLGGSGRMSGPAPPPTEAEFDVLKAIETYLKGKGLRAEYSHMTSNVTATLYDKNGVPIVYRIAFFDGELFAIRAGFGPSNIGSMLKSAMEEASAAVKLSHSRFDIADPKFFDQLDAALKISVA